MLNRMGRPVSLFFKGIVVVSFVTLITGATIGDGTISIYTGKAINTNDTRGSCLADGILFMSETAIPREHPCHYCICYQSQVACYWKQCAAPPDDCEVMEFENVCNPSLYVCEIPKKARKEPVLDFGARLSAPRLKRKLLRRKNPWGGASAPPRTQIIRATRVKRGLRMPVDEDFPVEFQRAWELYRNSEKFHPRHKRAIGFEVPESPNFLLLRDTSCTVFGVPYNLGEVIGVASDVCMECRCAAGSMFCSPKCCFLPTPYAFATTQGNAIFVRGRTRDVVRPPHPLHYVRNQFAESQFLR